ncbi:MAG TPA: metal-dependent hydrolase [Candidatus Thermoplasmatota archaeon]|nr:metal-dependent hydrolase [Candidatus Thermoplasmatota archaeon]
MHVTWHGHACYSIETRQGKRILVDPFLTGGPSRRGPADFRPDAVLLTHGHGDHTGDVLSFPDAHLVTNWEIGAWALARGMKRVTRMNVGGFAKPLDGVRVWMAPATHSSGLDASPLPDGTLGYGGGACGFVVDDGETRLYVAGDTGLFGDMRTVIRDVMQPHAALLPIGDLFTMGPEHAAIAAEWLGVDVASPCHYDSFPPIRQDPQEFARRVGARAKVVVPRVDEGFDLDEGRLRG